MNFHFFLEWSVVHFLHQSLESKESDSFFNNVITDLSAIERTVGAKKIELTNFVKDLVKSIKRALAPTKKPINKAENLGYDIISDLIRKEILS